MTLPRTTGRPNHHHQAQCEPTLALMESIAATIPGAVLHAKLETWESCVHTALQRGVITEAQADAMDALNPYSPAPAVV